VSVSYADSKNEPDFPRLAGVFSPRNLYLIKENIQLLSKFDCLMMSKNMGQLFPEDIRAIRKENPDIILLAYINSSGMQRYKRGKSERLGNMFYRGIQDQWWVRGPQGDILPAPASKAEGGGCLNVTHLCPLVDNQRWNTYIIDFLNDEVLSSGLWDGVMFDVVKDNIAYVSARKGKGRRSKRKPPTDRFVRLSAREFDLNNDGVADDGNWVNKKWREGYRTMFTYAREKFGEDILIVANGDHTYYDYVNGKVFENFPKYHHATKGDWIKTMELYHTWVRRCLPPKIIIFDTFAEADDYQALRFGLTSALMNDGYFSHETGNIEDKKRGQILWYDEYDNAGRRKGYLGKAKGPAKEIMTNVHRRDFESGIVLCNMSKGRAEIELEREFRKIKGTQDTYVNDGSLVREIILPPEDGIILLNSESE